MQWRVSAEDNGLSLVCKVWNQAIGDKGTALEARTSRLTVHCKDILM